MFLCKCSCVWTTLVASNNGIKQKQVFLILNLSQIDIIKLPKPIRYSNGIYSCRQIIKRNILMRYNDALLTSRLSANWHSTDSRSIWVYSAFKIECLTIIHTDSIISDAFLLWFGAKNNNNFVWWFDSNRNFRVIPAQVRITCILFSVPIWKFCDIWHSLS